MPYTFAIIGGGLTATSMLCQLVDTLSRMGSPGSKLSQNLSVVVFEKMEVIGPGLPHNAHYVLPFHITNMCAKDMTVLHRNPSDFQDWVQHNSTHLQRLFPELTSTCCIEDCCHYPRAVMGEYLKSRFAGAVQSARSLGVSVKLHTNCEVTDLVVEHGRISLSIRRTDENPLLSCRADGVLLATGHWFSSTETTNYYSSPWPAKKLLAAIAAEEQVGVIGSSLSAIEVALTLTSDGNFIRQPSGELRFLPSAATRKLTFYSRNGLLPRVRGKIGRRKNEFFTCNALQKMIQDNPKRIALKSLFVLLNQELAAAYGFSVDCNQIVHPTGNVIDSLRQDIHRAKNGDGPEGELVWQTVLVEIFPVVRELYLNVTLAEREQFDKHFHTLFFMHAATQPIINAEKLLALMQAGVVSIVKLGREYRFEQNPVSGQFEFTYTGIQGDIEKDEYKYVVNASGQPRSIESDTSMLTQNLLRRGLIQITEKQGSNEADDFSYKTGSIVVDPETHQVLRPGGDVLPQTTFPLFAVGAMTRGQMIDASMAHGIAKSTAIVAENVITLLKRCREYR